MHTPKLQRLEAFSDGVMAIAITLLAFDLNIPVLSSLQIDVAIKELLPLLPGIFTFVVSFLTIAIFWVNHHQMTDHMEILNRRIIWANMAFLMFQTLIPFATRSVTINPNHPLSVATFSFVLFCGSLSFSIMHLLVHRLINKEITWNSKLVQRSLLGPIVYACAVIASFNYIPIAYFLIAIPLLFYFLPKSVQA